MQLPPPGRILGNIKSGNAGDIVPVGTVGGIDADVVVPIPDSGVSAAIGFSQKSNIQFELGIIKGPSLRAIIITSLVMWFIKTTYLFFVGTILFPSAKTNCSYRKILILVAYCQVPLFLNLIIISPTLLILAIITYCWYNISLIIGLKIFLNHDGYIKTILISLAPQIIFLLYIFSIFQTSNVNFS